MELPRSSWDGSRGEYSPFKGGSLPPEANVQDRKDK